MWCFFFKWSELVIGSSDESATRFSSCPCIEDTCRIITVRYIAYLKRYVALPEKQNSVESTEFCTGLSVVVIVKCWWLYIMVMVLNFDSTTSTIYTLNQWHNYQQNMEKTHALKSLVIIFCTFQKLISPSFWTDRFLVFSRERDPPRARKCFGATACAVALQRATIGSI
jgi:hypothetical protein